MKAEDRIYQLFAEANPAPRAAMSTIDRPAPDAVMLDSRRSTMLTREPKLEGLHAERSLRRRWRGPALAAATFVAVAAVLGVAIWLVAPGDDTPVATDATVPSVATTLPSTETAVPQTATTAASLVDVTVPDLDGLTVAQARELTGSVGLELVVVEGDVATAIIVAQEPAPGARISEGSEVRVDAAVTPTCAAPPTDPAGIGEVTITVLYECGSDGLYPTAGVPVPRVVPEQGGEAIDRIEWTLLTLLAGPTEDERTAGFGSFFDDATSGALNSVSLSNGQVVVDFNEAIYVNNASTSTGGMFFNAELRRNLFQHPEVDSVEFRVNGNCEAWSAFFQSDGCWIITRADWDAQLAEWDQQRSE